MNDFRDRALCRDYDPELWFPTADPWMKHGLYKEQAQDAIAICHACPVRAACLEFGMSVPFGIFGGLTPEERRIRGREAVRVQAPAVLESATSGRA